MKKIKKLNIRIGPSKMLKGQVGLFAVRNLAVGTIIGLASKLGESTFVSWKEFRNSKDIITKNFTNDFALGNTEGFYFVEDPNYLSVPWFMNHSCEGNVGFDFMDNFITIRQVKAGEELAWDYGLGESNPSFIMKCKCGKRSCRKVITGNDWKNPNIFGNNKKYMLSDLRNIILK